MQLKMDAVKFSAAALAETIALIKSGAISSKIAKELLPELLDGAADAAGGVAAVVEAKGMGQISDEGKVRELINAVMAANPKQVGQYRCASCSRFLVYLGDTGCCCCFVSFVQLPLPSDAGVCVQG